jgi:hypothetical protein
MSGKEHIEAQLDRSLQNQVRVPTLGKAFDAAVWARIEAAEAPATNPGIASRAVRASRWLAVTNAVGISVTLAVAFYFAMGSFTGVERPVVDLGLNVPVPALSQDTVDKSVAMLGQLLGIVALLFGLSFTSLGRRLRASFS